ncbi:MAG: hypothetical protein H0Z33_13075 [Bacillaceae bacterium]|nr:hypothetical protein [Bacillaceae bacterium]
MLGFMLNQNECLELNYILRKELEEILLDLGDSRIEQTVKLAMRERYGVILKMFERVATPEEVHMYRLNGNLHKKDGI